MTPWMEPVTLEGDTLRLEPLGPEHVPGLFEAGREAEIWRYMPIRMESEADAAALVEHHRSNLARGGGLGFAQRVLPEGVVAGSTSYLNADAANRRVEIGFTWLAPRWHGTSANPEAKLLLLRHAFETLGCMRVEFKTDARNAKSRAAIARLGAKEEGVFRRHMIMPDGALRDSVYFSIIDEEWESVRARLEERIGGDSPRSTRRATERR